ncbi:MAG TPA: hypothetical protein VME46_16285, partial [Acidimicrobiales bacterium]|nr:hypothetical protein [Acidimicrobiales bacterium]
VSYTWTESYEENDSFYGSVRGGDTGWYKDGPTSYPYTITLPEFTITVVLSLAYTDGKYTLTYSSSSVDPGSPAANIPSDSILNTQQNTDCGYSSRISQATENQIDSIDFGPSVQSALAPIFASILETGSLGNVTFDFSPSDSGVSYPVGGGIQLGASGDVDSGGTWFSSTQPAPADVALPPVPTGSPQPHVAYNAQDYEFDALFWGFFQAKALSTTITSGEISDPAMLETDSYKGTPLAVLQQTYPDDLMTAAVSAIAAPTVVFGTIYQLTSANLALIQQAMGATSWSELGPALTSLSGDSFVTQAGFEQNLRNANTGLEPYYAMIEQYAGAPAAVVTQNVQCVLNVVSQGNSIPVITFDVAQEYVLESLGLAISSTGTTQTVTFTFSQPLDVAPTATFVSSTFPNVDSINFGFIWLTLEANWMRLLSEIGQVGVPLPRIPGFDFLFDQAQLSVVPPSGGATGYLNVVTNLEYQAS